MQVLLFLCFLVEITVQVHALVVRNISLPQADPFYNPPFGWELAGLGKVLKSRQVEIKTVSDLKIKEAWQVMYRTSFLSKDQPTTSVTTILVPYNATTDRLLTLGYFEDANPQKCEPSYTLQAGVNGDFLSIVNVVNAIPYLNDGMIVTIPDKQGRHGSFAVGHIEGHQTLDAIRATLAFDKVKLSKDVKIGGWGYSGGALQIGWASQLMPSYAPELNVVGWVFGGTPTNLEDLIRYINKKPESGLIVAGVESMRATYPTFDKVLKQHGTSNLSAALEFTRTHCQLDVVGRYKNIDIFSKNWTSLGQDLFKNPAVNKAVGAQVLGQPDADYPSVPILMAHGKSDEIVPFDSARKTFSNWCSKGLNGEFLSFTYANATHEASEISLTVPAFKWLSKRFNETDLPFGCSYHTDDEFVKPNTYNATLKDVVETIEDLLGRKVGPDHIIL